MIKGGKGGGNTTTGLHFENEQILSSYLNKLTAMKSKTPPIKPDMKFGLKMKN